MSSQLNVYSLGQFGIDIVNSPLHVKDGSLHNCQNAQLSPNDAELAIKKRDGMVKINTVAAAGTIVAVINLPFD